MQSAVTLPPVDARQRYSIPEGVQYLRLSRSEIYARIKSGTIKVIKDGKRTFVPGTEIIRLSTLPSEAA